MVLLNLFSLQKQLINMTANANNAAISSELIVPSVLSTSMIPTLTTSFIDSESANVTQLPLHGGDHDPRLPTFELILGTLTYLVIIGITILGNTLVILAVFSYNPLKKVQNYFIVSLAASDMLVAMLVMPLHVVKFLANGHWLLGVTVCQLFTTADIMLCTSSILNLCAIAIDRYWAIHDPIEYAQKRSLKLVGGMIVVVWVASAVISVPPLIGWNDWTSQTLVDHCELTSEPAFVVFSACGSFFLPLLVMVVVYLKIFLNARKRIRKNRGRSALFKMSAELDNDKRARAHRIPVAATSMIALASATGQHIFRKKTGRKTAPPRLSIDADAGVPLTHASAARPDVSSSSTTTCSLQVPAKADPPEADAVDVDPDSGHGGSNKDSPENTLVAPPPPPTPASSMHTLVTAKRHSLSLLHMETHIHAMTSSTSLMAMPTIENGGGGTQMLVDRNATQMHQTQQRQPETVELKKHLKEREKISVAKEKRAAKTIAVIIFVFTFCWLPFFCVYVIMPFCPSCYLHPKVHQAFVWLGYINSSLNPFLYGILNLEFRRAFRKILCPKRVQNAQRRRLSEGILSMRKKSAGLKC